MNQWHKWHSTHRNYAEAKKEIIAEFSAHLEPEDVIDTEVIATVIDVLMDKVEEESKKIETEIPHFSCPLPCEYRYDMWRNVFIASTVLNVLLILAVVPFIISLIKSDVPEPLVMDDHSEACKRLLLDELGLLKAMYKTEELEINEPQNSAENGQVTQLIFRQQIDGISYEVIINLSTEYPIVLKPSVFVRSTMINCDLLNRELRYFIDQEILGIPLILIIIQWISDNISRFKVIEEKMTQLMDDTEATKYARFWIYSHHIYNKMKRRTIKDTATFYRLDGFFCSGKPGVIIVEGLRTDCDKFWEQIRNLSWQHIELRFCEEQIDQKSFLRLGKFREIYFPTAKHLAELKKILIEADLEYGFALLLNL
ncbi:unnamed protein product [Onchocerca ochengi]|uniref:DUF1115 domain-containing protein n=1 Tax=Onchocerca ochengi TaxID=42157 RepID=A0A182EMJ6_ONCOC|nr:unnamed protein product [Onchocerca ochengi]